MKFLIKLLLTALLVFALSNWLPGVAVTGYGAALGVAIVLGIMNALVRPILIFLTLPATIVSLGLFLLVINAVIILLVDWLLPGFAVTNFWWALLFSILLTALNSFLNNILKEHKTQTTRSMKTSTKSKTIYVEGSSSKIE